MDSRFDFRRFLNVNNLLLCANFLLLICFFCQLETIDIGNYFNSDSLYLPSIYRDLFVDGNGLKSWHFNGAPNFFPDMLVYFVLMFLSKNDFITASFVFSFLQYFLILYLFTRLFKSVLPGRSSSFYALIYLLQTFWLLEFLYLTKDFIFVYFLLCNSYHTGSFVMALSCFLIVISFLKQPHIKKLVLLFSLVFLSVFSDKIFVLCFLFPLGLSGMFLLRKQFRSFALIISVSGIAALLAKVLYDLVNESNYIYFLKPDLTITAERTNAAVDLFFSLVHQYTFQFGFRTLCICLFVLSVFSMLFLLIQKSGVLSLTLKFYILFTIFQSVVVLFAPVIIGNFTGFDTLRYNIYPLYLSGLNLAVVAAVGIRSSDRIKNTAGYFFVGAALVLLVCGFSRFSFNGLKNFFSYYPETARRLDEVAEKEGLVNGVANFWYAKSTTMFSKKGIRVVAVFDGLYSYIPVTNESWFYNQNNKFNFVLLNNFGDTSLYRKKLLKTEKLYDEPKFKLVKTNIFTFDRATQAPKNN